MKNIIIFLSLINIACWNLTFANFKHPQPTPNWTGFYLGANAGYWWAQTDKASTSSSVSFINQTFDLGASNVANALVQLATNSFSLNPNGFIGGGQMGYNYQYHNYFLFGLDTNFSGSTNSNNTFHLQKTVNLIDFNESYLGSLSVNQNVNYLGSLRARIGYLVKPNLLIFTTGGFAYANVSLDLDWNAQESLGAAQFPTIDTHKNQNKTLAVWTVGAGVEWLFKSQWSTSLEYTYYSLSDLNSTMTLAQINNYVSPAALWGSASANTALSLAIGTIEVGIKYHFL